MISEQVTVLQRYFNELNIADHLQFNLLERQQLTEIKVCNREREGEGRKGETVDAETLLSFAENMETIQKREENLMMCVRENFQSDF